MSRFFSYKFLKLNSRFFLFLLISGVFFGISILLGNYYHMPLGGIRDFILIFFHWCLVCFAYLILIYALSLQKIVFLLFFPVLNTISSIVIYYIVTLDISINSAIIGSIINTNMEEVSGLVSVGLIAYLFFILFSSILFAIYRFKKINIKYYLLHVVIIIAGISMCLYANKVRYKTIGHRVPFALFDAIKQYRNVARLIKKDRIDISENAICSEDSLTVVLVLGEALRSDHVGINGYFRSTTPRLKEEKVISFKNIYSEWTHTNQSVPHILTRADSVSNNIAFTEQSFISIFKKSGFKIYWIGNQEPGNTYVNFIHDCDTSIINKPFQTVYNFDKKLDEELLEYFDILQREKRPLKLFILHTLGSHWFYASHYPDSFEHFTPTVKGKTIKNSDRELIINAYDNTVLYTDYVLSKLIDRLKEQNSVFIYLSDHGEVLGEGGKWLHAQGTDWERNPACFLWFSEENREVNSKLIEAAVKKKNDFIRTDFLFHSILQISSIESPYLNYELSIFNPDSLAGQ